MRNYHNVSLKFGSSSFFLFMKCPARGNGEEKDQSRTDIEQNEKLECMSVWWIREHPLRTDCYSSWSTCRRKASYISGLSIERNLHRLNSSSFLCSYIHLRKQRSSSIYLCLNDNCSYALVSTCKSTYIDDDIACAIMIDDHWCRWVEQKRTVKNESLYQKERKKGRQAGRMKMKEEKKRVCVMIQNDLAERKQCMHTHTFNSVWHMPYYII